MNKLLTAVIVLLLYNPILAQSQSRKQIALLNLIDTSPSTLAHAQKLKILGPMIKEAMAKSSCDFKVAVGPIAYEDIRNNDLTPWGEPAFVDMEVEDGGDIIESRIELPSAIPGFHTSVSAVAEKTYSSIQESIQYNLEAFDKVDAVAVLLFTDASPSFETLVPGLAMKEIEKSLQGKPFIPAIVGPDIYEGSMYEGWYSSQQDVENSCFYDVAGNQVPGNRIKTFEWKSKEIGGIKKFIDYSWGMNWDICAKSYETELKEFLDRVMTLSDCNLMM